MQSNVQTIDRGCSMKSSKYEYTVLPAGGKFSIGFRRNERAEFTVLGLVSGGYETKEAALEQIKLHIEDDDWKPELVAM